MVEVGLKTIINYAIKTIFQDFSLFGNLLFYLFIICLEFAFENYLFSFKLFLSLVIGYLVVIIIRLSYYKSRPNKQKYSNLLEKLDSSSFPSMHAVRIMLIGLFFIDFYKNYLIALFFMSTILIVGYSRYYLKKHYTIDIVAGYITGICVFLLVNLIKVS